MGKVRFLKEYIVVILIIVFVIFIEFITGKNTSLSIEKINYYLSNLDETIKDDKYNSTLEEKMNELSDNWHNEEIHLSYYMEHNELEKISSNITILKSNLKNISDNNYAEIRALIDETKYRLEYIKNKQKLGFKNIF